MTARGAARELTDRVRATLTAGRPGLPVGDLVPLPGGHSGLTYTVSAGDRSYVVKAVPPGRRPVGRDDVLRQAQVLRALADSPVPVPRFVLADEREPAWFAMEFATGEAVEPVLDEHVLPPALCRARMLSLAGLLRLLHRTDLAAPDLAAPEPLDPAAELARWSATMRAVPEELRDGSGDVLRKLSRSIPAGLPPVLVHGDFRLGNVLCREAKPAAVVDWEIWGAGDPRTDLGWFLLFSDHRHFPRLGRPVPDLPTERELLAGYLDGRPEPPAFDWFRALSRLKMAAIMGHNLRRHREGRHHDPDQERLPPTIAAMIRAADAILD